MSRLSTMVLMGIKLPLEAVMRQIASGIDILVHLGRLRDKSRKVLEIMEVLGYEKGEIRLQPLFSFQETGSKDGKIQGEWVKRSTLTRTEKLMAAGYQPEGVCPGDNGKHSSGVSDRHAVLFKTMDDGSAFSSGNEVLRKDDLSGGGKGKRRFERQFQDALQSLEAQLNVGYSMENAIKEAQRDLQIMYDRHTLIVREFTYMVRQLNLNVTAEAAWKDFAARVALPEVDTFVTVFSLAKRSGGDSILIIKNAVRQLGDKAEVKREIDTVIAAEKNGISDHVSDSFGNYWLYASELSGIYVGVIQESARSGFYEYLSWSLHCCLETWMQDCGNRGIEMWFCIGMYFFLGACAWMYFKKKSLFRKWDRLLRQDIFFDVGGDKSGIFVGNRAEDRDGKL